MFGWGLGDLSLLLYWEVSLDVRWRRSEGLVIFVEFLGCDFCFRFVSVKRNIGANVGDPAAFN